MLQSKNALGENQTDFVHNVAQKKWAEFSQPVLSSLLKNSELAALTGVEAPNPERMTGFDFAHPDVDSLFNSLLTQKSCFLRLDK